MTTEITTSSTLPKPELDRWAIAAEQIRANARAAGDAIIRTGRILDTVKQELGHGKFLAWIDLELGMSQRSARNYMRAAAWAEGKSATVAVLPPSTLYLLASPSVPPEVPSARNSH